MADQTTRATPESLRNDAENISPTQNVYPAPQLRAAANEIERLRMALAPFAAFADPRRVALPTLVITQGSSMAKRQLTMGDCYIAKDMLDG